MKSCLAFLCTSFFCCSLMAQATEPTDQPTDLVIEFAQGTEYSVSFTAANGSPDGYLVLVKEGSSPTEVPVDLDEYSSGGNTIGSSLVVYVGSTPEFTFSGWTAGVTYYFDVFSYNGSTGTYNYLTSSPLEGSFTAISPEPFGAPYGLDFVDVTSNSILLEFRDPPSPEPASYLILMSAVSSPTEVPVDGTSYTSGQLFGSSKVLVVSDPTIYIDNLDPETQYYFDIYAFLGSGTLSNYFTTSALEGSTSTLAVEPTAQPTGLTFSNITLSMTVSFTAASGNPDGYLVLMSASSPPPLADTPEDGGNYVEGMLLSNSKVVHYGSETSFTVSNLEGSTTYYFQIYSFNGETDAPNFYTGETPLEGSQSTPVADGAWSELNSGLYALDVNGVALLSSNDVLAATAGGVFRSDDLGSFWQPSGDGIPAVPVLEIIRGGSNSQAFAATSTMVYESGDGGVSWSSIGTGFPGVTEVYSLFWNSGNSTLYAATTAGVYRWNGTTWTGINTGLTPASVRGVAGNGSNLVVVTAGNGVFRSTNNGSSWSQTNIGLSTNNFAAVTMSGSTVLIGGTNGYVYRSSDAAASWSLSLQAEAPITDLEIISSFYLAATDGDGGYGYFGGSWQHGNTGLGSLYVTSVTGNTSTFFAGTADQGVYRYVLFSNPAEWTEVNDGLKPENVKTVAVHNDAYYASIGGNVYRYENSWTRLSTGLSVQSFVSHNASLLAGTDGLGVLQFDEQSQLWTETNTGLTELNVNVLFSTGEFLFAGTGGGIFRSADNGATWSSFNTGLSSLTITSLTTNDGILYAGTSSGVFKSALESAGWTEISTGLTDPVINCLSLAQGSIFAGTESGVFIYNPNSNSWSGINNGLVSVKIRSLYSAGLNLFAATEDGVYFSSDLQTWGSDNNGLSPDVLSINTIIIEGSTALIGTPQSGIWTRQLSQFPITPENQSSIQIYARTEAGFTVGLSGGDGKNSLVVVKSGSPVDAFPSNGQTYTANSTFGNGSQLGSGNFVVGSGSGSTFSVTGLVANTAYYVRVFEFNGNGTSSRYNLSSVTDNPKSAKTLTTEPATQASSLEITPINSTSVSINFVNGSGESRLLVGVSSDIGYSPIALFPPYDGFSVSPDPNFGSGQDISASETFGLYPGTFALATGSGPFTVTGLNPDKRYFFQVFEYNGSGETINYKTTNATLNPNIGEPLTQASTLALTDLTPTTATLSFANGSGTSRLLVAKSGSAIDQEPQDGMTYFAGASFGTGYPISTNTFAVAKGSGPVTLTGLTPEEKYYVKAYEYNDYVDGPNTLINYKVTGSGNAISFTAPALEPTTQATNITFQAVGDNSLTLNFSDGNGTSRIVLCRQGSAVNSLPVDGTTYNANPIFGSGSQIGSGNFVVGNGSGPITITGLTPETVYHFRVIELNGSAGAENYNLTAATGSAASHVTKATEPSQQAKDLIFSNIGSTSFTLDFTAGNGSNRIVFMRSGVALNATPVDEATYVASTVFGLGSQIGNGNFAVASGVGPVTITNLLPGVTYHVQVFEFNGANGTENYNLLTESSNPMARVTTVVEPDVQSNNIIIQATSSNTLTVGITAGNGTSRILLMREGSAVNANPVDGFGYSAGAEFGSGAQIGTGNFVIGTGPGPFTITNLSAATTYHFRAFEFNGAAGTENYNVNVASGNPVSAATYAIEPAAQPTDLTFPLATQAMIRASFSAPITPVTGYIVLRRIGSLPSETPADGTTYSQGSFLGQSTIAYVGASNTFDDTGLSPNTQYHYAIYAYNGTGASTNYLTNSPLSGFKTTQTSTPFEIAPPGFAEEFSVNNKITVDVNGARGTLTVLFYHRGIAEQEWSSLPVSLKQGTAKTFEVTLASEMTDELGMEFYFTAHDGIELVKTPGANNYFIYKTLSQEADQTIPFSAGFNGGTKGSQMFSVPYELNPNNIEDVFDELGAYDITKWRVFHYDDGYKEYKKGFNNIEIGKGYWLNAMNNLKAGIKPGTGVVVKNNQVSSFSMTLKQGWNQIGNPYPFAIDWTKVSGTEKTGPLVFYSNGVYDNTQLIFAPWRGAFIHADVATTVTIPVSAKTNSGGRTGKVNELGPDLDSDEWLVPIEVTIGGIQQNSGVGMHPQARVSKDGFDHIAVPRFTDFVEMTTRHDEFFSPDFSRDITLPAVEHSWLFEINSNIDNGPGDLKWDHLSLAQHESSLVLIDLKDSRWVDMKTQGSYSFTHREGRQIKIVYNRTGEIKPGATMLGDAYPNPFTSRITIPVLVGEPGNTQIEVFDGMGRRVATFAHWFEASGIYEVDCDFSAHPNLGAGILYYRLISGGSVIKRIIKH